MDHRVGRDEHRLPRPTPVLVKARSFAYYLIAFQAPTASAPCVSVRYRLAPGANQAFLAAAVELRRLRRRTGAVHWHLHRDLDDPERFDELFIVGSWEDHERQHARIQAGDRAVLTQIDGLLAPGETRTARHALGVRVSRRA